MKKAMILILVFAVFGFSIPVVSAESVKDMLDPMASNEPQENTVGNAPSAPAKDAASTAKVEKTKTGTAQKAKDKTKAKARTNEKKPKKAAAKKGVVKHPKAKKHVTPPQEKQKEPLPEKQ